MKEGARADRADSMADVRGRAAYGQPAKTLGRKSKTSWESVTPSLFVGALPHDHDGDSCAKDDPAAVLSDIEGRLPRRPSVMREALGFAGGPVAPFGFAPPAVRRSSPLVLGEARRPLLCRRRGAGRPP